MIVIRLVDLEMTAKSWMGLVSAVADDSSTIESLLLESQADYKVVLNQVYVFDKFKDEFVAIPNRFVTGREINNSLDNWEVVKERYNIEQNERILSRAFKLAAKSGGSAKVLGCGSIDDGRKFFAVVNTSSISFRCSSGRSDYIDNYIVVITSHDGSLPICYYNLDVRRETGVVYRLPDSINAEFSIRKRHTPSEANIEEEVAEALDMRLRWTKHLSETIKKLFRPLNSAQVKDFLETVWPTSNASTEKRREHAEAVHDRIQELLSASHNHGCFGHCAWSMFNAASEYIDFYRDIPNLEASQHMLELDNYSHRIKIKIAAHLLSIT